MYIVSRKSHSIVVHGLFMCNTDSFIGAISSDHYAGRAKRAAFTRELRSPDFHGSGTTLQPTFRAQRLSLARISASTNCPAAVCVCARADYHAAHGIYRASRYCASTPLLLHSNSLLILLPSPRALQLPKSLELYCSNSERTDLPYSSLEFSEI